MSRATMSILGLWNYDPTIFDNFVIPTGVNKDNLINNLIAELAELEVIYPDTNFMKMSIGFWSAKELPTWNKLKEAFEAEYNPIENYDRYEEYTDETTGSSSSQASNSGSNLHKVAGYNSDDFKNDSNDTSSSTGSSSGSSTGKLEHDAHIHGNIGVTTNQQMLEAELKIRPELNIINFIIDSFKQRFCLQVY